MATKTELETALKDSMRSGDDVRKRTLRMALSAIKLAEVEKRGPLDEPEIAAILHKEAKTRNESIAEAEKAERPDLVEAARAELQVVESYLPEQLSREEIVQRVRAVVAATGARGPQDVGKVMKELMPGIQGRADGKVVSAVVREVLGSA